MVQRVVGTILHGVDPLSYFSLQPVHHNWCMCYPICGMVHKPFPSFLFSKLYICFLFTFLLFNCLPYFPANWLQWVREGQGLCHAVKSVRVFSSTNWQHRVHGCVCFSLTARGAGAKTIHRIYLKCATKRAKKVVKMCKKKKCKSKCKKNVYIYISILKNVHIYGSNIYKNPRLWMQYILTRFTQNI